MCCRRYSPKALTPATTKEWRDHALLHFRTSHRRAYIWPMYREIVEYQQEE